MLEIQINHPISVGKENRNLSRKLTRIFGKFKSDPLEEQDRHLLNPEGKEVFDVQPCITEDLYFDENFPESVSILYRDTFITLHEDHISIHDYLVPSTSLKQIHYREIACVYNAQELGLSSSQGKMWGSALTGIWWALDKKSGMYRQKYDTMILTLHNSKRIGVSIKDSCQIGCVKRLVQEANNTSVLIE